MHTNSLSRECLADCEQYHVTKVMRKIRVISPDLLFLTLCYLQRSVALTHLFSHHLFSSSAWRSYMSVIFETCGFLFCQKHPLGFGMHVEMKGCMQHVARVCEEGQDFPCFSTPPPSPSFRSLRGPPKMSAPNAKELQSQG